MIERCAHAVWQILTGVIDQVENPDVKLEFTPETARARHEFQVFAINGTWIIRGYPDGLVVKCQDGAAFTQVQNDLDKLKIEYRGLKQLMIPFNTEANQRIAKGH